MSRHVAVLMGGWSAEREVSLVSGAAVAQALAERGFRVTTVDVRRDLAALVAALTPPPDVVFNALHGRGGEDGCIQGVLEYLGVPYTHSGVAASAIAMNKPLANRLVAAAGVRVPEGVVARRDEVLNGTVMAPPYVIKPTCEGSSVGVHIVRAGSNRMPLDGADWTYGDEVLVERYVPGRDLTVAVMGDRALAVTEIRPHTGFYDYTAKYTAGQAEHLIPAPLPAEVYRLALDWALAAHATLGCRGVTRSDFRWDDSRPGSEGLYFLEINTQPGMTPLSLVPEQAAHVGIPFGDLVAWMVEHVSCHA